MRIGLPRWGDGMQMFHRRLLLLGAAFCAAAAVPLLRTCDLTIRKGESLREQAEGRLVERRWIGTSRGKILDRDGRVLAIDKPSFNLEVDYPLISGQWAFAQAVRAARRRTPEWTQLSPLERERLVQEGLGPYQQRLAEAWAEVSRLTGVPPSEIEERRSEIVARVSAQALAVWESHRRASIESLSRGRELTEAQEPSTAESTLSLAEVARPIREQRTPHVLVRDLDEEMAFTFPNESELAGSPLLPGMKLVDATRREYPSEEIAVVLDLSNFPGPLRSQKTQEVTARGVATGIIGWMRGQLFKEDFARRPPRSIGDDGKPAIDLGAYRPGDSIGAAGLEWALEPELRGARGSVLERLDTGQSTRVERTPGKDVRLTLDSRLQARVQALMNPLTGLTVVQPWQNNKALDPGTPLNAAAVILDIDTGEILSMVSTPTFTRQQLQDDPASVLGEASGQPLLSRAMGRAYAPGSIVKPLMLAGGVAQGVWEAGRTIDCTGHFHPDRPDMLRCWIYKQNNTTHTAQFGHPLTADEAVMVSCNIYFFTLGQKLGPEGIEKLFASLGVGTDDGIKRPDLGVGYQFPGSVGRMSRRESPADESGDQRPRITAGDAILMGIGQGPIAWTPLQAADAYATLARGGIRLVPKIRTDVPSVRDDLGWDRGSVQMAMRGLQRAVSEERGSGHHITYTGPDGVQAKEPTFNIPGVSIWGKSGTADSGKKSQENPDASLDHSWFVVMAGAEGAARPRVVVALLVEYGGSGGRVAGPLANQILWALRAEGYL
ncbi:MAG: peptidoglycan D,D-transpeptidase FtsI family protein [bacterium]